MVNDSEVQLIRARYEKRSFSKDLGRYSMFNSDVWKTRQERQSKLINLFKKHLDKDAHETRVLEVGCGTGNNLLELLLLGFKPDNLVGNELIEERFSVARSRLPNNLKLYEGDFLQLNFLPETFDVVYQSTVFSSLLDDHFQKKIAGKMWELVRPGGGILWYDLRFDNPMNLDIRGIKKNRIKQLFPFGKIDCLSVTLAPPISRSLCKISPNFYSVFNTLPLLRSHLLCWIKK